MILKVSLWVLYLAGFIVVITCSQYTDDADYNDDDIHADFLSNYKLNDNTYDSSNHNDFYISAKLINTEESVNQLKKITNSYKILEKVYRYTKHRIPGYDYDEFDFTGDKNIPLCDDKSVWTHCLCQFTCDKPNTVDCYTPCISGCECKENYVFDENTQRCVYPEYCQMDEDDIL